MKVAFHIITVRGSPLSQGCCNCWKHFGQFSFGITIRACSKDLFSIFTKSPRKSVTWNHNLSLSLMVLWADWLGWVLNMGSSIGVVRGWPELESSESSPGLPVTLHVWCWDRDGWNSSGPTGHLSPCSLCTWLVWASTLHGGVRLQRSLSWWMASPRVSSEAGSGIGWTWT